MQDYYRIIGKLGYISWTLDGELQNLSFSDDGSDIAMASVGIVYRFD